MPAPHVGSCGAGFCLGRGFAISEMTAFAGRLPSNWRVTSPMWGGLKREAFWGGGIAPLGLGIRDARRRDRHPKPLRGFDLPTRGRLARALDSHLRSDL